MLWALLILFLCGMPGSDIPHISFLELLSFDKFVHAGIFFVLFLLMARGFELQSNYGFLQRSPLAYAFLISVIYGGLLEVMQDLVFEERSADVFDFIANSFGCLLGLLFYKKAKQLFLGRLIN